MAFIPSPCQVFLFSSGAWEALLKAVRELISLKIKLIVNFTYFQPNQFLHTVYVAAQCCGCDSST